MWPPCSKIDPTKRDDVPAERRAETAFVLARALWQSHSDHDHRERGRVLAERALEHYGEAGEVHAEAAKTVRSWLRAH